MTIFYCCNFENKSVGTYTVIFTASSSLVFHDSYNHLHSQEKEFHLVSFGLICPSLSGCGGFLDKRTHFCVW